MAKQARYPKSFRMKLEKIKAAREAREARETAEKEAEPFDPFKTLWHEFITTDKDGRAAFIYARAPDPDERPFRFYSEMFMKAPAIRFGLGDIDFIDVPPPWKHDTDAQA